MKNKEFRGKDIEGIWRYGNFVEDNIETIGIQYLIIENRKQYILSSEETVGKCTGLISKNYKKHLIPEIYEGDIFRSTKEVEDADITVYSVVMWIDQLAAFYLIPIEHYNILKNEDVSEEKTFTWLFEDAQLGDFSIDVSLMKVGNIYDNSEYFEK